MNVFTINHIAQNVEKTLGDFLQQHFRFDEFEIMAPMSGDELAKNGLEITHGMDQIGIRLKRGQANDVVLLIDVDLQVCSIGNKNTARPDISKMIMSIFESGIAEHWSVFGRDRILVSRTLGENGEIIRNIYDTNDTIRPLFHLDSAIAVKNFFK